MQASTKVLIVDDDYVYKLVTQKLINRSYPEVDIVCADSGLAGMQLLNAMILDPSVRLPDMILLDIQMPQMNGWEFLEEFHQLPAEYTSSIKIYMVSSSMDAADNERIKQYPAVKDLMVKPLSFEVISKILAP